MAGQSKTGTKSMAWAMQELGMNVYDAMEHYVHLEKDWIKILTTGGTPEDLRRMYKGVDAVTDIPVWYFWEEFLEAFPECKVVLTEREEDSWIQSMVHQTARGSSTMNSSVMCILSPTFQRLTKFWLIVGTALFKGPNPPVLSIQKLNVLLARMQYRRHYAYIKATAPKDRLLVFNMRDGWEPLCRFLDLPIPNKPFPHRNKNGEIVKELMQTHPVFKRMQLELTISMGCIGIGFTYVCFRAVKYFLCK